MNRVTGIGGIFFKARDAESLRAWYRDHLGIKVEEWGGAAFQWQTPERPNPDGVTIWNVMPESSTYLAPSAAPFMINYRVEDLHALIKALRDEGCNVVGKIEESEYGKFGWVLDPEGNKVELWEPPVTPPAG